jgi:hypothetical protein
LTVFLRQEDAVKKAAVVILFAIFLPFQSRAYLLCQRWAGYSGGWVQSSSSGWNNTHNWWGSIVTVPTCGYFVVTTETYDGDNDGSWLRHKSVTNLVYMPEGYQVGIYGTIKQAYSNDCGEFWLRATLMLRRPNGTTILQSQRIYYLGNPNHCCGSVCGSDNCMCNSNGSEDIDRAWSKITVRPATEADMSAYSILWSEAAVTAVM